MAGCTVLGGIRNEKVMKSSKYCPLVEGGRY